MAYSYNVYTGNGSTTQFAIGFLYIRREHVVVSVNYVSTAFTWVNNTTVQVSPAPANAARVEVRRVTPVNTPLVDFADGSTLVAADLDINALQQTYINQEQDDQFQDAVFINSQGLLDAGGKRITNVGDPVNAQDVATKNYVGSYVDATAVASAGDAMTGPLAMGGNKITGLASPTTDTDAVNRSYVNSIVANGIGDGDKGDIVVSGNGSVLSIDAGVINDADVNASAGITAGKLSFTQAGTGATARTIDSKLKDVVSVKDFGAVGDGVADDTAAIQAALNTGRFIYLPAGTYKVSSALTVTVNNTGIQGEGYGSVISTTSTTADVFTIGDGVNSISGLRFFEFTVWSSVTKSAGIVFNCRYVANSSWYRVGCGTINLYYANAQTHRLHDGYFFNRFSQNTIDGGEIVVSNNGIKARGNSDQSFGAELSIDGGLRILRAGGKGLWLGGGCGGVYVDRVDFSECFRGIFLDSSLASVTNREVFLQAGCTIDACSGFGLNVEANGVALLEVTGAWIASCGNASTVESGVRIAPSAGVSARWSNIRIYNCYGDGIAINSGTHCFSGGFVRNCGTGTPGGHGIYLVAADQTTITGMMIHNNGNSTRGNGVSIEGTVTNYNIESNALFGNGQAAFYQPSGPSLNQIIRDNRGWVIENSGTAAVLSGNSSVVVNHGLSDVPTNVQLTFAGPQDGGAYAYAGSFTSTQFTITYSTTAGANRDFFWKAKRG